MTPAERVSAVLRRHLPAGPVRIVVAVSGGCDSVVLLHLLRFGVDSGLRDRLELVAAHLDHGMRPGSGADTAWVTGLCRAWGVRLLSERLTEAPSDEAGARDARLSFLEQCRSEVGAELVLTAHHADDQAETVLFRILRGTGVHGLRGIPERRGTLLRPLLRSRRAELRDWAGRSGLRWREDPTNHGDSNLRARLRPILRELEAMVPSAVQGLNGLADRAVQVDGEVEALAEALEERLGLRAEPGSGRIELPAEMLELPPEALRIILRRSCASIGVVLDAPTTERLATGILDLATGARLDLRSGAELHRTREGFLLLAPPDPVHPRAGQLQDPRELLLSGEEGAGRVELAGARAPRRLHVAWGDRPIEAGTHIRTESITLPLTVRGWRPGDRIRLRGGTRRVVTLLSEAGVPVPDRPSTPVVSDAEGAVHWIPDLGRRSEAAGEAPEGAGRYSLWMEVADDDL